jgi:hypothetical protein
MVAVGVGAGNGNYATPANTSLGSIGLGYIYTDWLAQINYTTPSFGGFKLTIGIFDPLEPITQSLPPGATAPPESSPGFHAKIAYENGPIYLSATMLSQKHEGVTNASDFDSFGFDVGGKLTFGGFVARDWLPAKRMQLRPTTIEGYERMLRLHILPALGGLPLPHVRTEEIQSLYGRLLVEGRHDRSGGLAAKTVHEIHTLVLGNAITGIPAFR